MVTEIKMNINYEHNYKFNYIKQHDSNELNTIYKFYKDNTFETTFKKPRSLSLNTATIYENVQQNNYNDSFDDLITRRTSLKTTNIMEQGHFKETFQLKNQIMEEKSTNRKKQLYKNRKHFSDYDIVYLQVDDANDNSSNSANNSAESLNEQIQNEIETQTKLDLHDFNSEDIFRKTRSDSNLSLPPRPKSANQSQRRSSSQIDITQTQTYKDIYADNLRQYSFLLAKQLGTSNKSPDQLRKSYLKSRKKEVERRERANTGSEPSSRHTSQSDLNSPTRKLSNASNFSSSSLESLQSSKYTSSLTDITNLSQEKVDFRRPTTVIRRKNKKKIDSHKRLSAPLLNSEIVLDIEREIQKERRKISLPAYATEEQQHRRTTSSLSVPDLSDGATEHHKERKLSEETVRRQEEAKERLQWRMSRLTSFEGILSQAGNLIKDYKRKKSSVTNPPNIDNDKIENTEVSEKIKIENNNNNNADASADSALITSES